MKLVIMHFQPLEGYPPVMNMLNFLAVKKDLEITCFSNKGDHPYEYSHKNISIKRPGYIDLDDNQRLVWRLLSYLLFNISALIYLFWHQPSKVMYYETLSALPVYLYKSFLKKKADIFIHYHEYVSPKALNGSMKLMRNIHTYEKRLYPLAKWISQTNAFRMNKFVEDENLHHLDREKFRIMPNYPPQDWADNEKERTSANSFIRLVYVGYSLSFATMFVQELFNWVKMMDGKVILDCYLHKQSEEAKDYLDNNKIRNVKFFPSINYYELPNVLHNYDVGLIIYKGTRDNYKYNAPNKLFEYLSCGLDVWFPNVMEGSLPYVCKDKKPSVVDIDFENLSSSFNDFFLKFEDLTKRRIEYYCESVYESFYECL